ncbi:MAG: AI-2E family transporter [Candidatus Nanoarchaeia archaeon]|jgi:predicted PurR-regulated permease PerM
MYDPKKKLSKYIFIAFFIILGYLAFLLVKPFLGTVILSLIVAYALLPIHKKVSGWLKGPNISAALITTCIVVFSAALLVIVVNLLATEYTTIYEKINITELGAVIKHYIPGDNVEQYVGQFVDKGLGVFLLMISSFVMSIPEKLVMLFIAVGTIFFTLRDHAKIKEGIRNILPLTDNFKKKIEARFSGTVDAVLYSMVFVSLLQGIVAGFGFYLFGIRTPVLWGFVTFLIAMLPFVGPTTVWLPLAIYLFATGHSAQAIGLSIYCLLFVTILLDMIWKPKLISEKGKIHPLIAILGVLGGFSVFGFSGIILGPFVLSLFIFVLVVLLGKENLKLQD